MYAYAKYYKRKLVLCVRKPEIISNLSKKFHKTFIIIKKKEKIEKKKNNLKCHS